MIGSLEAVRVLWEAGQGYIHSFAELEEAALRVALAVYPTKRKVAKRLGVNKSTIYRLKKKYKIK